MKLIAFLSFLRFRIERVFAIISCSSIVTKNDAINEDNCFYERIDLSILV